MAKSKVPKTKRKEFFKSVENQGFVLIFSCEGNVTSSAVKTSGLKCIKHNTIHNTVNRWRESNSFCSPLLLFALFQREQGLNIFIYNSVQSQGWFEFLQPDVCSVLIGNLTRHFTCPAMYVEAVQGKFVKEIVMPVGGL